MRTSWNDPAIPNRCLYEKEIVVDYACKGNPLQTLILHRPEKGENLSLVLWLHGGGLINGIRECPDALFDGKRIIIEARYRMASETSPAEILDDAALAAVCTLQHAAEFGGNSRKCFFGGMSAGCYLAAITAFDRKRITQYDCGLPDFAGLLLLSGQFTTHFRVKEILHPEQARYLPFMDEYAPMSFLSATLPPMLIISGEPGLDIPARPEESAFAAAYLKAMGHQDVEYIRLPGCSHGDCLEHGGPYLVRFMERIEAKISAKG